MRLKHVIGERSFTRFSLVKSTNLLLIKYINAANTRYKGQGQFQLKFNIQISFNKAAVKSYTSKAYLENVLWQSANLKPKFIINLYASHHCPTKAFWGTYS